MGALSCRLLPELIMIMKMFSLGTALIIPLVLTGSFNSQAETRALQESSGSAKTHIVEIKGFKYSPEILTVSVGDTVRWINLDTAPHTATAGNGSWNSGKLKRGEGWTLTATEIGETRYICIYHPVMKGTLIIKKRTQR